MHVHVHLENNVLFPRAAALARAKFALKVCLTARVESCACSNASGRPSLGILSRQGFSS
jgi:hypothetical protein